MSEEKHQANETFGLKKLRNNTILRVKNIGASSAEVWSKIILGLQLLELQECMYVDAMYMAM